MNNTDPDHVKLAIKVYKVWLKCGWEQEVFGFQEIKKPYVRAQGDLPKTSTHRLRDIIKRRKWQCYHNQK